MEELKKQKKTFKNPKGFLKGFKNFFVISVFLLFFFIMAVTTISVWLVKKSASPGLTLEDFCVKNLKVIDPNQEDVYNQPLTSHPVLRIFGKDINVCKQACLNLRPFFNIEFECVPLAGASQDKVEEIYTAFSYSFYPLEEDFLTENDKEIEKPTGEKTKENFINYSTLTQGDLKMVDQELKMSVSEEKREISSVENVKNLFLETNPETIFFIEGHTFLFNGIPNKEDICELTEHENCPARSPSSFLPFESPFSLIKKCYAWGFGFGRGHSSGRSSRVHGYTHSSGSSPRLRGYTRSSRTSSGSTPRWFGSSRSRTSSGSTPLWTRSATSLNIKPNGLIDEHANYRTVTQGSTPADIQLAEQGRETAFENRINILNLINDNSVAAAAYYPDQSFYSIMQNEGHVPFGIISGVERIEIRGQTVSTDARTYITFGDGSLSTFMINGSPYEITTPDGNRWRREPLRELVNGRWEFVMNPVTGQPMFGYRLLPPVGAATSSLPGAAAPGRQPAAARNHSPIALITCSPISCKVTTREMLTLRNSSFDLEDGINFSSCRWEFFQRSDLNNPIQINPTCGSLTPTLSCGQYQAKLRVTDQGGLSDTATRNFDIVRAITADFEADNWNPYWGATVHFTDQSVPTQGETLTSWSWTFEDGQPASSNEQNPSVVFSVHGTKNITLTVTDSSGRSHSVTKELGVRIPLPKWEEVHPSEEAQSSKESQPSKETQPSEEAQSSSDLETEQPPKNYYRSRGSYSQ